MGRDGRDGRVGRIGPVGAVVGGWARKESSMAGINVMSGSAPLDSLVSANIELLLVGLICHRYANVSPCAGWRRVVLVGSQSSRSPMKSRGFFYSHFKHAQHV